MSWKSTATSENSGTASTSASPAPGKVQPIPMLPFYIIDVSAGNARIGLTSCLVGRMRVNCTADQTTQMVLSRACSSLIFLCQAVFTQAAYVSRNWRKGEQDKGTPLRRPFSWVPFTPVSGCLIMNISMHASLITLPCVPPVMQDFHCGAGK